MVTYVWLDPNKKKTYDGPTAGPRPLDEYDVIYAKGKDREHLI